MTLIRSYHLLYYYEYLFSSEIDSLIFLSNYLK